MTRINHLLRYIILPVMLLAWLGTPRAAAISLDSLTVDARLGYSLGGTVPAGIPATIRHLNSYKPSASGMLGVTVALPIDQRWSLHSGLRFERYAMSTDAHVKNYDIAVTRGGESLEGIFLGDVRTNAAQTQFTLPLQAGYRLGKQWRVRLGLYMSLLTGRSFDGWAHDGYMRADEPTGAKVELGHDAGERGDYEFDDHMRSFQWGIDAGADWQFSSRWGAFAELIYGVNGLFQSDFHTVSMKLHPLYGTLGVIYKLK